MAVKAVQVTEAEKDQDGVEAVPTPVPGVGTVTTYWKKEYVDDVTGKPAENTKTYRFAGLVEDKDEESGETFFKTVTYEVDLSEASRAKLIKALEPFTKVGRQVTATISRPAAAAGSNPALTEWNRRVKAWLEENRPEYGVKHNTKGRIKGEHEEVYLKANPSDPKPA